MTIEKLCWSYNTDDVKLAIELIRHQYGDDKLVERIRYYNPDPMIKSRRGDETPNFDVFGGNIHIFNWAARRWEIYLRRQGKKWVYA